MTTIPRTPDSGDAQARTEEVRRGVVHRLAVRGVVATSVESLFGGREWSVTVSGHPDTMTDTEVRVAVWTA
ncbi:hypothetical protein ACH9EU_17820, partial [Kocuria sp. M1R5S2]|uniref:hypothetical protein n=1 Tax=Kocuria rhizosphaerae TaxID=3376285 RepID=UPI0037A983EC